MKRTLFVAVLALLAVLAAVKGDEVHVVKVVHNAPPGALVVTLTPEFAWANGSTERSWCPMRSVFRVVGKPNESVLRSHGLDKGGNYTLVECGQSFWVVRTTNLAIAVSETAKAELREILKKIDDEAARRQAERRRYAELMEASRRLEGKRPPNYRSSQRDRIDDLEDQVMDLEDRIRSLQIELGR